VFLNSSGAALLTRAHLAVESAGRSVSLASRVRLHGSRTSAKGCAPAARALGATGSRCLWVFDLNDQQSVSTEFIWEYALLSKNVVLYQNNVVVPQAYRNQKN